MVGGGRQHHGIDAVAIGQGPVERLQHHRRHRLADGDAVGGSVERGATPGRRQHAGALHQAERIGIDEQADAAHHGHLAIAARDALASQVERDQRRRARRVDRKRRTAEVEMVGNARGQQRREVAGHAPGIGRRPLRLQQPFVARGRGADIDADPATRDTAGRISGILQRQPRLLQEQPLLRVGGARLARRQAEQAGVEQCDAVEETADHAGAAPADQPATLARQRSDQRVASTYRGPELGDRASRTEAAGEADHGDRHRPPRLHRLRPNCGGRGSHRGDGRIAGHAQPRQSRHQGGRGRAFEQRLDAEGEAVAPVDAIDQPDSEERAEAEIGEAAVSEPVVDRVAEHVADDRHHRRSKRRDRRRSTGGSTHLVRIADHGRILSRFHASIPVMPGRRSVVIRR